MTMKNAHAHNSIFKKIRLLPAGEGESFRSIQMTRLWMFCEKWKSGEKYTSDTLTYIFRTFFYSHFFLSFCLSHNFPDSHLRSFGSAVWIVDIFSFFFVSVRFGAFRVPEAFWLTVQQSKSLHSTVIFCWNIQQYARYTLCVCFNIYYIQIRKIFVSSTKRSEKEKKISFFACFG